MMIERYAKNGWLKHGAKMFGSGDRLWAARRLYFDYVKSRGGSVGVIDTERPKVDGGKKDFDLRGNSAARENFLKAFKVLNPLWQKMIEKIVLEDKELEILTLDYKKNLAKAKKELSAALDCLILHYMAQDQKDINDARCFR